jgi:hypothetical protein
MRVSTAQPLSLTSSWAIAQGLAGRHPDHVLDQIDAGDKLGDRVLDLQAGIHLEK